VFGGWVIEPDGSLSDFIVNREYQPTLAGIGWRAAVNEFEGSIQRRHMGRESDADFGEYFRAAELIVPIGEDGSYAIERDTTGHPVLHVYSSEGHLPAGQQQWARTTGAELADTQAPELTLTINPGGRPETRITLHQASAGAQPNRAVRLQRPPLGKAGAARRDTLRYESADHDTIVALYSAGADDGLTTMPAPADAHPGTTTGLTPGARPAALGGPPIGTQPTSGAPAPSLADFD
jgi:hypothetical protein